ncbi:MAG: ABC transporter ATP-binding protein, partial [Proteobacteria bacterium]|nr:ABC transporter ATP-binding protein [Pseudomonadota bacterium]
GKSLTALSILRLLPEYLQQSGSICFEGQPLEAMSEHGLQHIRGARIGMIFQEPMTALNPLLRLGSQVAEVIRIHQHLPRARCAEAARDALARVGLDPALAVRYAHQLSGGQRQRACIAMVLVASPRLLIADEPTTALDPRSQDEVLDLLCTQVREQGIALLLISHDLHLVARYTQRLLVMQQGAIVEQGASTDLLTGGVHPHTRSLVVAARLPPMRLNKGAEPGRPMSEGPMSEGPMTERLVPVLEVEGVACGYGKHRILEGIDLSVARGESVGLVGESGAGKSTLLRAILGVHPLTAGSIRHQGRSLWRARGSQLRRLRRGVQAVFQDPVSSFDPRWRVDRLVGEPLHLLDAKLGAASRRERVHRALDQVGLGAADAKRHPHEFSGGQR